MIGTFKMLAVAGAVAGATAMAQPALADHGGHGGIGIGIGFDVRPSRSVVVGPSYFAPTYITPAPYYNSFQGYSYYQPNYYYTPPVYYAPQVVYPSYPSYGYYSAPYAAPYYVPHARQRLTFGLIGRW